MAAIYEKLVNSCTCEAVAQQRATIQTFTRKSYNLIDSLNGKFDAY